MWGTAPFWWPPDDRVVTWGGGRILKKIIGLKFYEEQLKGLAQIAIEREIASSLDTEKLVATFAKQKERKIRL